MRQYKLYSDYQSNNFKAKIDHILLNTDFSVGLVEEKP